MKNREFEQNQRENPGSMAGFIAVTGFFGGVFWSTLGWIAHFLHFTDIHPNMILEPWTAANWRKGWLGTLISIFIIGLLGIAAAYVYFFAMKRFQKIWAGILFGVLLFLLVFFVLNPLFPSLNPIWELELNTIITTVCLYILFGVFAGYTISYEYHKMKNQRQGDKQRGMGDKNRSV